LRVCDIFERVSYINVRDGDVVRNAGVISLNQDQMTSDVYAVIEKKRWAGFEAYRVLAERIPLLWPALPILYLLPPGIGHGSHRDTAHTRAHAAVGGGLAQTEFEGSRARLFGIVGLGTTLVLVCSFCGADKIISGWPFACYPTFSLPAREKLETLGLVAGTAPGEAIPVEIRGISYDRLYWVLTNILATSDPRLQQDRLRELWMFAVQSDPRLKGTTFVKFYRETWWTAPELWKSNPSEKHLLFELDFTRCADPAASGESPACPPGLERAIHPQYAKVCTPGRLGQNPCGARLVSRYLG
jgi:hypothetical protein